MTNNEILKKQIIYRASHRGSKEMDLLLGNFVKTNINKFTDSELLYLENLMKIDDDVLYKWHFRKNAEKAIPVNKVSKMLKEFKIN